MKNSNGKIGWNKNGELTTSGVTLPGTNIVDLIGDVMRARKTVAAPPGIDQFARGLSEINVPREVVGNRNRLSLIFGGVGVPQTKLEGLGRKTTRITRKKGPSFHTTNLRKGWYSL